ncbi:MAG: filamentous hemagglutinin N-terminal domain-containing protein [Xenococcaceae cyanobacterium MO_167.B27]|nr:filamentous hemagglutinin N-terminal domain-containing protein [Xenococcaceae cyanobacterium MO_167.B27]
MFNRCDRIFPKLTNNFKLCKLWSFPLALILIAEIKAIADAQIIPDNTLPQNSIVAPNGDIITITGGTIEGNNLFHSFEQFSIFNGQTAFFDNSSTIANIISRVTGKSISDIDGLIKANGTANLFLLNPNGIIFGSNAALDIGGSFVSSTANSIKFADGSEFSAINAQEPPLLTISIPIGLQYGSNAESIIVEGGGNNLIINQDFSLDRSNRPDGLKVADGQTLALVGKDIKISGGNITAAEGNIELWAVNNGLVSVVNSNGQLQIESRQEQLTYGNIELSQAASVDASGNSGGGIQVQGKNITVQDGSVILTDTLGNGSGGNLNVIGTESVKVQGISALSPVFSGILADVAPEATGNGGNIVIKTDSLQITDGGQISSGTFGVGNAGTLKVTSQNIKISGGSVFGPSGLFTPVALGARGNGGNLTIETSSLEITDAGQISSGTFGFGDGGDLTIKADDIYISGGNEFAASSIDTTVFKIPGIPEDIASFLGAGVGNGGNLIIETGSLRVSDGAQIAVSTSGTGQAGNLNINAENVELLGLNELGRSGLFASAIVDSGNGGDINLTSDRLSITNGATINVGNFSSSNPNIPPGTGTAGDITIKSNSIQLDSSNLNLSSSINAATNAGGGGNIILNAPESVNILNGSQITAETLGSGNGGTIQIETNNFNLSDRSTISTSTESLGDAGTISINSNSSYINSQGKITTSSTRAGQAGGIKLNSDRIITNEGLIIATSEQTGGGDIEITTDVLQLQNNSLISTSVLDSSAGGGNIAISSDVVLASGNSNIRANAVFGDGGNIDITTEVIVTSVDSDIDASSQFGLDGIIEITSPETDKQFGITQLPTRIINPTQLILATCPVQNNNIMVLTGKGGLPSNPYTYLQGQTVWQDLRTISTSEVQNTPSANTNPVKSTVIIEANQWQINENNQVELVAVNTHQKQGYFAIPSLDCYPE